MKLICCDFSLRRPGFAVLDYDEDERKVSIVELSNVDNKNSKKPHGQILGEIAVE